MGETAVATETPTQTINPVEARQFVAQFVQDPKVVDTMAEPDVLAYHGKIKTAVDSVVENRLKERGDFGPDWRKAIAGDNVEALPTLERFASPKALYDSYSSLRSKISAGELKSVVPFPATGTPEQQAAWKAEQGLPSKPEDYKITPPAGVTFNEDDKQYVNDFVKYAHTKNMPQEAVNLALGWWGEQRAARVEQMAVKTAQVKQETEDKLRAEWGNDYRPTRNRIDGVLDANLPAGSPLRDKLINEMDVNPEFARLMANIAMKINPGATLVAGGAENQVKSIGEWLAAADKLMRTDRKAYNNSEYSKDYGKYAEAYKNHAGKEWGKK